MKYRRGSIRRFIRLHLPLLFSPGARRADSRRKRGGSHGSHRRSKDYRDRYFYALDAPIEDAKAVQAKLQALGFQTEVLNNPNKRQLTEAVDAFGALLARRGGVGLLIFPATGR